MRHLVETAKKLLNCGGVRVSRCRRLSRMVVRSNWVRTNPGQALRQSLVAAEKLFSLAVIRDQASFSPWRAIRCENPDSWQERCDEHLMSTHFQELNSRFERKPRQFKSQFSGRTLPDGF